VAACSGRDVPARASDAYVVQAFDRFADGFDFQLKRLEYRAPALILEAVAGLVGAPAARLDVLDAGAGTGWCGPLLRPYARTLTGVDLSPRMLAKATERQVYDRLEVGELTAFMAGHLDAFDLIVSADTLVYFGDLGQALRAAAGALRPGGHLAFTVEHATDDPPQGFRIGPHGRYGHGASYVRQTLVAAGLSPLAIEPAHLRLEHRVPVDGLVVTARR
jgi:predicted TPR repeat methyltransferase